MMNWLHYLLEANIYLAVAYGSYWLLFRKETFYKANRVYLLMSTVVCFIIPLIQIDALHAVETTTKQAFIVVRNGIAGNIPSHSTENTPVFPLNKALTAIYWTGVTSMFALLVLKLYRLLKLVFVNTKIKRENYWLVHIENCNIPYSFLHYLFADISEPLPHIVLKHELAHIRERHSWDILLLETVKIICWFNPTAYLIQHSLRTLHEFIADEHTVHDSTPADQYVAYLIANAHQSAPVKLTNNFSEYKLLKNRIIMLYQKPSGKLARLKYLIAAPVCAGLLCSSTLAFSKSYTWIHLGQAGSSAPDRHLKAPTSNSAKNDPLETIDNEITADRVKLKNTDRQDADTAMLESFYKQMGHTIRYPTAARKAHIGGQVSALIKTDNSGKISEVYLSKGISEDIDKEVLRAIKSYQQKLPDASTYYSLTVTVALVDATGNQLPFKSGTISSIKSDIPKPSHIKQLSEVIVYGYTK
jgi:hypothetical protein